MIMNTAFKKDLYRIYGDKGESLWERLTRTGNIKFLYIFRKCQMNLPFPFNYYYKVRLRLLSERTHIQILSKTQIGEGFYIGHLGRVVVNPEAKIGKNVNISVGATVGAENRGTRKGAPMISDNCWIGTNAVVVGNILIGSDVLIAPNAYVNFDVPSHSIVIGNPARIIYKENATAGYIENTVQ